MKIAVIGSGTMGVGIVNVFALHEKYEIIWCGTSIESVARGKASLEAVLSGRVQKRKLSEKQMTDALGRVTEGELRDCRESDLVIEAVSESVDVKHELFLQLQEICRPDCVFASDTSSLSITEISAGIRQPVVGMHFFNPAPAMKLVEVTPGLNTPESAIRLVMEVARDVGKTPIEVKENAGFLVNRMLIPLINEAIGLYAEGVASAADIDTAMQLGANFPMGPLALGDMIGLDVCLAIMEAIQSETGDVKYRPHPYLRKMVRGGHLGIKTGKGFFTYPE